MSTLLTSYHLRMIVTERLDPIDIYRFTVVQLATLPEEDPITKQHFYIPYSWFDIRYEFIKDTFALSRKVASDYLFDEPCREIDNLCTVTGVPKSYTIG
jgi:hypothetical protein